MKKYLNSADTNLALARTTRSRCCLGFVIGRVLIPSKLAIDIISGSYLIILSLFLSGFAYSIFKLL